MYIDNIIAAVAALFSGESYPTHQAQLQQELDNLRIRNQERMEQIKRDMGEKHILHPSHTKHRLGTPRPF